MSILVIAEHDNAALKAATLNTIAAAQAIGGEVHVLVAGAGCAAVAQAAAALAGVAKVRCADAAHYAEHGAENLAALVCAAAGGYTHLLAPASSFGKNLMPRVAAMLDVAQISDIISVQSPDTFRRPIYAGNAIATVQSCDALKVITVRSTAFEPVGAGPGAPIEALDAAADTGLSTLVHRELTQSERPELGAAGVIVSGGRGLGSGENYHALLEPLADKLGAALGASRAAVDAGYVPNDYQVGQTGK
ncbi:MAG: FAD-binding protein, partial [Rhodocyclaceae bacterium]|nr:FAD-binding protein [Rhodocyclaceae bacterium]